MIFAGVDGEMSSNSQYEMLDGTIFNSGGRLIQLGISFDRTSCLKVDLGWPKEDMMWNHQSAEVHKIPFHDVTKNFSPASDGDKLLAEQIKELYPDQGERFVVPIGWNVASFDMPFIRYACPETFKLLSRRSIDLNAVVYTMDGIYTIEGTKNAGYKTLKRTSKRYARWILAEAGIEYRPHDAGWDAQMSLLCYDYLRLVMSGNAPNMSHITFED